MTAPDLPHRSASPADDDLLIDLTDADLFDVESPADQPASWKHLTRQGVEGVDYDPVEPSSEVDVLAGHREWLTDELAKLGAPKDHTVPLPRVGAESVMADVTYLMDNG